MTKKPNRKRNIHFHFWAEESEAAIIHERAASAGVASFGAYIRKLAIDGLIISVDLSDVRDMVFLLRKISNNINQIAKRTNETRNFYAADVEELRRLYDTLWDAANKILAGLAAINNSGCIDAGPANPTKKCRESC